MGQPHLGIVFEELNKNEVVWAAVKTMFVGGGQTLRYDLLECRCKNYETLHPGLPAFVQQSNSILLLN